MAYLAPDKTSNFNGVTVKEYLLTKHNPNRIDMPTINLPDKIVGITVHNTQSISVAAATTMAEQYTRATVNGNMGDVRVHFYVDDKEAWQNLPLTLTGWHAADGNGNGNRKTIAIECIMNAQYGERNERAERNCARLVAYLLDKYGLTSANVYSHSHWYSGKTCPLYILPHWDDFIKLVQGFMPKKETEEQIQQMTLYRVRKSWEDVSSQIGAYRNLESAKGICTDGYYVFDDKGNVVYPIAPKKFPVIQKGSKGTPTKVAQTLLQFYNYDLSPYGADGDFGSITDKCVREFQKNNNLSVTGIIDEQTWIALIGG